MTDQPDEVTSEGGAPRERPLGSWAGRIKVPDDLDETPQWLIDAFEGADEDPATWP
jgi:hypothetical protein